MEEVFVAFLRCRRVLILLLALAVVVPGAASTLWAAPASGGRTMQGASVAPELVLQNGHTRPVTGVSFSADGKSLATASEDETIKLWDVRTGRVRATLRGHELVDGSLRYAAGVLAVAFSPDGRRLASGSRDQTVRIWDVATEKCIAVLKGHQGSVTCVAWTPDGRQVVSGAEDSSVRVWDVSTGRLTATLAQESSVRGLSLAGDARVLAVALGSSKVALWDLSARRKAGTLAQNAEAVAISGDGRTVAVGSWDGTLGLWDVPTSRKRLVKIGGNNTVTAVAFAPDGKTVVAAPSAGAVSLVEVAGGRETRRLDANPAMISALAFSPDGALLASGGHDDQAWLLDVGGHKKPLVLKGAGSSVSSLACTPDGRSLVTGSRYGSVRIWDLVTGRLRTVIPSVERYFARVALSSDGTRMAVGFSDGSAVLRDLAGGREIAAFPAPGTRAQVSHLAFSRDGRTLAIAHEGMGIQVWETPGPRLIATLKGQGSSVSSVVFAPDGRTLYSGALDGSVQAWDMRTRKVFWTRRISQWHGSPRVWDVALSPDGAFLAATSGAGTIHIWEVAKAEAHPEEERDKGQVLDCGVPRPAFSLAYSPDGRLLATAVDDGVYLFDVATGKKVRSMKGHVDVVSNVAFVAGGRVLVSGGLDTTVRFWDVASGSLRATALELEGGKEWVVTSPDGLFDGSSAGQRMIEWRVGGHLYALDQFFNHFFSPGLLGRVAGPGGKARPTPGAVPLPSLSQVKPPPRVVILSPQSGQRISGDSVAVAVKVFDQGGGATPPALYVNGKRVQVSAGQVRGDSTIYNVTLAPGRNVVRAMAANAENSVESRGEEVVVNCEATPSRGSRLFVVAVGIDQYQAGLKLGFAVKDARAVAGFFKPGLFSDVKVRLLLNGEAQRRQVIAALEETAREATPQDAVVLYLAGHGTALGDLFYFLPHDARVGSDEEIRASCISSMELGERLSGISATKQVVILDACHSGASASALGRLVASRDAVEVVRAQQKLARASGTFLVAASTADQYAKEFPELGHGVLTYAILTGLGEKGRPAATLGEAGNVTVNALLQYVSDEVPQLAEKYQGGRQDVVQFSTGQDFPLVVYPSH